MKSSDQLGSQVMAFHHSDGFPAAYQQALKFAGEGGRLATMPDITAARLESKPGDEPWETYYTTLTAEYCGVSKSTGRRVLIIAHGVGPMSTLDGIKSAYGWEFADRSRNQRGGRITQEQFWELEAAAGQDGNVVIVDLADYCKRYEYPFLSTLRVSEALTDPVLRARLGPFAEQYVQAHAKAARAWHLEERGEKVDDPYIITVNDPANLCYGFSITGKFEHRQLEPGLAMAHLISTGGLCVLHHQHAISLTLDVGCHEWWNGVRVVGIKAGGSVRTGIHAGPDAYALLRKHWREMLVPVENQESVGFRALTMVGDQWFTQYPKQGERMDTHEPEYVVTGLEKIGEPVQFRTTGGSSMFFRFGVNEVQAIAPPGANAYYFVGEPVVDRSNPTLDHVCMVQFYRAVVDTTKRMRRSDSLAHDYDTLMRLVGEETTAA